MCGHILPRERYETQVRFIRPHAPRGASILELGCATGELAKVTREMLAIDRYDGVELSPARAKAKPHLDTLFTDPLRVLLAQDRIDRKYDLVLMSHVLEHLEEPAAEVRAMKRILKPGGAIFLEVPNRSGNPNLPIDDNLCHMHFFSVSSLSRMLAAEGLETIAAATGVRLDARCNDALQVIAKPFELPTWSPTMLSDKPEFDGEDEIVAWGAGGLAQLLLANYFDMNRIAFFVDRDPGKQGTTCIGRPVRSPEAVSVEARTILINSVDFADSIEADIRRIAPDVRHRIIRLSDVL